MKALTRGAPPPGLDRFRHGQHQWEDVSPEFKCVIWIALEEMQRGLCAYCEGSLDDLGRHIDHHHPRSRWPQWTFEWTNLLGSCARTDSCGHYKDHGKTPNYAEGELVDPSREDPDGFFIIRDNGRIEARPWLSRSERARAEKTIAVLNLNLDQNKSSTGRSLCAERRRVLESYLKREPDVLAALAEWPLPDQIEFIRGEIDAEAHQPFGSIVRHFFTAYLGDLG